jgi:transcriptional antiterminator RfaH
MPESSFTRGAGVWSPAAVAAVPEPAEGAWWAAHTRPRAEKQLAADLARLGLFCYLPLRERVTRNARTQRLQRSVVPVFSGYLFFVATEAQRHRALTTRRIVSTLTVHRQDRLVAELRHLHVALAADTPLSLRARLHTGRWVRICDGPLAGVEGVVSGWRSPIRVALNVNILGQSVTVEALRDQLEPIDPPGYAAGPPGGSGGGRLL